MRSTIAAAMVFLSSTGAFADGHSADTVVARVNGVDITLGHMLAMRSKLPEQYQSLEDPVLFSGILDQLIDQTVLSTAEEAEGDGEPASVKFTLDNERRLILANNILSRSVEEATSEEAVKAAYDEQFAGAAGGVEWNASHILVETEEAAKELITTLEGGADFAELAKEKSTGPSGPNGGSLGWFGTGQMVPAFETAVKGLEAGGISAPVQTQFGWHVVKLNETREKQPPALEEVRDQITADLQNRAVQARVSSLKENAEIERIENAAPVSAIKEVDLLK
jgi:peptidyl-prolyl cis-trans isomerase C